MRKAYRGLGIAIVVLVGLQASFVAFGDSSMGLYVESGGVIDQSTMSATTPTFDGVYGFVAHGMNGMILIPLVALALLVVSFFAKFPRAVPFAGGILALVALQITLGMLGHSLALIGALHGLNALALASLAFYAQLRAGRFATAAPTTSAPTTESKPLVHD